MYEYVEDKTFLSDMKRLCGEIMQDLCHTLRDEYDIGAVPHLVGSGARNLILQNANNPIDLDYNLEIVRCEDFEDCRFLNDAAFKAFRKVLRSRGLSDCHDSHSVLTSGSIHFTRGNQTNFSIDVCIVTEDVDGHWHRLIHDKTGYTFNDRYYWNEAPHSKGLKKKVDYIKAAGKWLLVREQYKRIKNKYLTANDHNHPSFVCYIEAVNNVYNSRKTW